MRSPRRATRWLAGQERGRRPRSTPEGHLFWPATRPFATAYRVAVSNGNVWTLTDQGIMRLDGTHWQTVTPWDDTPFDGEVSVSCIATHADDGLWLAGAAAVAGSDDGVWEVVLASDDFPAHGKRWNHHPEPVRVGREHLHGPDASKGCSGYRRIREVLWSSWTARRPVKAEAAGSNPVRTATFGTTTEYRDARAAPQQGP